MCPSPLCASLYHGDLHVAGGHGALCNITASRSVAWMMKSLITNFCRHLVFVSHEVLMLLLHSFNWLTTLGVTIPQIRSFTFDFKSTIRFSVG